MRGQAQWPGSPVGPADSVSIMQAVLPAGTVTILFSDIEGSTLLLSRLGNRFADALDAHRGVLRAAWAKFNGYELRTEGDSFFVVFEVARDAVAAALEGQLGLARYPWPDGERVRVRIGIHTGEPVVHGFDYVGMDVHRAARIASAAHGGQVVVSNVTRELAAGQLPPDTGFADLGWHQLKDLPEPEHLFQATADGLKTEFAPLKSLGAVSSLPVPPTPLVGRDGELRELQALFAQSHLRLITLTGAGGSGKTRLAIALGATLMRSFLDGVYFVALAEVTTREGMWRAIADALGVTGDTWDHTNLLESLKGRRLLLLLDNLEQLPDAAKVVSQVLAAAPEVVVVATSRRPLHLQGEHEHPVPPLTLPDEPGLDRIEQSAAVRLFAQHAQLVRPSFALTLENSADVATICRRVDGLPLAIELAASRIKLLSPVALVARLDQTMGLGALDVDRPTRQQTLQGTIAWSYDLLPADLQRSFRQLGVFAGGCDLDAITAVIAHERDPLDVVAELVDVSLVSITDAADGEPRIALLRTVAEFAVACLTDEQEIDIARRRHAEHYVRLAEKLTAELWSGSRKERTRDALAVEHDNITAALAWALELGPDGRARDGDLALRLAGSMWQFWEATERLGEGRRWLETALDLPGPQDPAARARALSGAGTLVWRQGDNVEASVLHEQALALYREVGDTDGTAFSLNNLGVQAAEQKDYETADRYFQAAGGLGQDPRVAAYVLVNSGEVARLRGDHQRALRVITEGVEVSRRIGDEWLLTGALINLGRVSLAAGELTPAVGFIEDALERAHRLRDRYLIAQCVEGVALLASATHRPEHAARLFGVSDALYTSLGAPRNAMDVPAYDAAVAEVRMTLGNDAFLKLHTAGAVLTVVESEEWTDRALSEIRDELHPS
jgi:predicted ATPase/class 3 adenylate cyclase/Tfp pilus assembly protein PilF